MSLTYEGRCWRLGDDVSSDDLMSARHVYEYDPRMLRRHLLAEVRPELAAEAKPGDLLVAGRRFAHGSQHTHPFLAMREMGLGLVARALARPPFRLAVYTGVPLLEIGDEIAETLADGDRLRVDFAAGRIDHLDRGTHWTVDPLPAFLLDIVRAGGGLPFLRAGSGAASTPGTPTAAPVAPHP